MPGAQRLDERRALKALNGTLDSHQSAPSQSHRMLPGSLQQENYPQSHSQEQ